MQTQWSRRSPRVERPVRRIGYTLLVGLACALTGSVALAQVPTFTGTRWKSLGPTGVNGFQSGIAISAQPSAGRVTAVAVDPTNPNRWLIGASAGGVWETLNAGSTWIARTDGAPAMPVGSIAIARSNPRVIYVGTGDGNNTADSFGGIGVLKSTDGGLNWSRVASDVGRYGSIRSIWVDPANPNTLLVSVGSAVFGRIAAPAPTSLRSAFGVYRSTDGGATFVPVIAGRQGYDLAANPANPTQLYAALSDRNAGQVAGNGIYRSNDGGATFVQLTTAPWHNSASGVGRIELAVAPSSPGTMYVGIEKPADGALLGLWRTDNAWDANPTWTQIPVGGTDNGTGSFGYCGWNRSFAFANRQCWYTNELAVDPSDANVLYAGGTDLWRYDGVAWVDIGRSGDAVSGIGSDQHALAFAGTRLLVGGDRGIWSTTDRGATPLQGHNRGLAITPFIEGAAYSDAGTLLLIGGAAVDGTARTDGAGGWRFERAGYGAATFIASPSAYAVSSQDLGLVRTLNGGTTFNSVGSGLDLTTVAFAAKVEMCPWNSNVVLAGNRSAQRRTDFFSGTSAWQNTGLPVLLSAGVSALSFGSTCDEFAVASVNLAFYATSSAGAVWQNLGALTGTPVSDIAFEPGNPTVLWLALARFDESATGNPPGRVARISNWADPLTRSIQFFDTGVDLPHNTIVLDPTAPRRIYVGTDRGIVRSTDGGATWQRMAYGTGMPNVPVHDLKQSGGRLFAFTFGRGAFELTGYDLNGDDAVTCSDYAIVRAALNRRVGDAAYSATADLNADGIVDVRDLRMIAAQLPTGCP